MLLIDRYYSGEKVAPILTIFVGGNHEASNYLQELPYGGWVAPNIYYMGYASVVTYRGLRIAGISGINHTHDYFMGHHEAPPYDDSTIRSVYHYRQLETFRLQQISSKVDIMISHDWPTDVYKYGNSDQLIRFKPHFQREIEENTLGSPPLYEILLYMKPEYWFSGHLHCKFAAVIPHEDKTHTKFLALDKCLPKRRFLQFLDIDVSDREVNSDDLQYDLEWLTVLNLTNHLLNVRKSTKYMPGPCATGGRYEFHPTEEEKAHVLNKIDGQLTIPKTFRRTVTPYDSNSTHTEGQQPKPGLNAQTVDFCKMLQIDDPLYLVVALSGQEFSNDELGDDATPQLPENQTVDNSNSDPNSPKEAQKTQRITSLKESLAKQSLESAKKRPSNPEEDHIHDFDDEAEDDEIVTDVGITVSSNKEGQPVEIPVDNSVDLMEQDDDNDHEDKKADVDLSKYGLNEVPIQQAEKDDATVATTATSTEILPSSLPDSATAIVSPAAKKLKRRNEAIYKADDED